MLGCLVHGNKPLGFIIGQECLNRVISDGQLLIMPLHAVS